MAQKGIAPRPTRTALTAQGVDPEARYGARLCNVPPAAGYVTNYWEHVTELIPSQRRSRGNKEKPKGANREPQRLKGGSWGAKRRAPRSQWDPFIWIWASLVG